MEDNDSDYERTLCQLPHCHCFKVPARKSAEGYRASDWPKDPIWTGKLRIVAKGKLAIIYLVDDANRTFATCPVTDDSCVERCLDSGRYFVIKIQNAQGKHAYLGIAFNERNDAFDFNVALSEHKSENERELKAMEASSVQQPLSRDFSLKEGEKIKIKIAVAPKEKKETANSSGSSAFLAPPPDPHQKKSAHGLLAPPPLVHSSIDSRSELPRDIFDSDPFGSFTATATQATSSANVRTLPSNSAQKSPTDSFNLLDI